MVRKNCDKALQFKKNKCINATNASKNALEKLEREFRMRNDWLISIDLLFTTSTGQVTQLGKGSESW